MEGTLSKVDQLSTLMNLIASQMDTIPRTAIPASALSDINSPTLLSTSPPATLTVPVGTAAPAPVTQVAFVSSLQQADPPPSIPLMTADP
jgi:hypothetical protein